MNERVALDELRGGISRLRAQIAADLERTAHPSTPWLEPKIAPDGSAALDVLIVGGGQSGLATAFGLRRSQVTKVLVIDKAVRGREGPWLTYARMPTLRSPKTYTGPDLDLPSLTYQSWHEARFGAADWARLSLIPTEHWARYLLWFRDVLDLPVRNGCELVDVAPVDGLLAATLQTPRASDRSSMRENSSSRRGRRAPDAGRRCRSSPHCRRIGMPALPMPSTLPLCAARW